MGVSDKTVRRIETGNSVKRDTYAKLERELGWAAGSVRRVLAGGEPAAPPSDAAPTQPAEPEALAGGSAGFEWTEGDETKYQLLKSMLRAQGLELTPRLFAIMKDQYEIEMRARRTPTTTSDDSR